MKEKVIYAALLAAFFAVFNMVAHNPFPVADLNDPDSGIGLWSIAFGLMITMSYAPLLLEKKYTFAGILFMGLGVLASSICGAFVVFLLFSVAISYVVISSEDVQNLLLTPFKNEK